MKSFYKLNKKQTRNGDPLTRPVIAIIGPKQPIAKINPPCDPHHPPTAHELNKKQGFPKRLVADETPFEN